ncbi:MAG: preprotein translocase subunit SecG [Planctomycetes bacterium]|nr:preprotein translocase subunit SecG [Planctomycetota bacterium]
MVAVTVWQGIVATLLVLICVLLILVILVQKGRGGGLAGAFGGAGGHSAFGAKTGDVFTWITVGLTAAFIGMAVLGNYVFVETKIESPPAPTPAVPGQPTPAEGPDQPVLPPTGTATPPATRPG